ncbi:MAG: DUF6268 family outer membrane beta-barrel protein [Flavobacterium sp.]
MKIIASAGLLFINLSFSQSPVNSLSYKRSHFSNQDVMQMYTDNFKLELEAGNYRFTPEFSITDLNLANPTQFDNEAIQKLYGAGFSLNRKISLKKNWSLDLSFNPQLRSNFESSINFRGIFFNAAVTATKKLSNEKSSFAFSLNYDPLFGKPLLYPSFLFNHNINGKLSFSAGFPKTFVQYALTGKNILQAFSQFESNYFRPSGNSFSRISDGRTINYKTIYNSGLNVGLAYNYHFYTSGMVEFSLSKSINNRLKIEEDNGDVTKLSFNNNFIVAMGFKYNLN